MPAVVQKTKKKNARLAVAPAKGAPTHNAYPVDTSAELRRLINNYNGNPIEVSFRDLVSWIKVGERATHYLHSYPAKLLPQIAHFFLAASTICKVGDKVLDPFGGTGTVALEAMLAGRNALYADANPLARLITSAKTSQISVKTLTAALARVTARYKLSRGGNVPSVVNLEYWYHRKTIRSLCRIKAAIDCERSGKVKNFLLITFSAIARKASRADPRFSVPVRRKRKKKKEIPQDAWRLFTEQFDANITRQIALKNLQPSLGQARCVGNDARELRKASSWRGEFSEKLPEKSVELIITSPPYAGAQKYIRASSLSLGWLDLVPEAGLRKLECASIGREHLTHREVLAKPSIGIHAVDEFLAQTEKVNRSRAAILAIYLDEMKSACAELMRVLTPGGWLVLVIGDNHVCGKPFPSSSVLTQFLEDVGLEVKLKLVDKIHSRGLMMRRHKTAGIITKEWIVLFQKPSA